MTARTNTFFGFSLMLLVLIGAVVLLVSKGMGPVLQPNGADMSDEAVAERIAPVAQLNTGEPIQPAAPQQQAAAPAEAQPEGAAAAGGDDAGGDDAGARGGEQVYNAACVACHLTGAAGAPKLGDTDAWAPRIEKGEDALLQSAINGLNAMPPRGTCADCSDAELANAIEFMVSQSQ